MDRLPVSVGAPPAIRFHFDIGSPFAYLAAERVDALMPAPPAWSPVLLGGIYKETGRVSWATTPGREDGIREIERRAAAYGLPPLVWPEVMPGDGLLAMRAAVAADERGAGREFARAAFRLQFAEGRAISDPAVLGLAAERAGLAADALLAAAVEPGVKARLRALTDAALAAGVVGVPTVEVCIGDPPHPLHWGDDRLEAAAADALQRFARASVACEPAP